MQKLYITAFFLLLFSFNCWAGVASNPFLRPGSNRTPPKIVQPPPPPKPTINPSVAQEVEFRGYFLLKGIPHFCIFNKKANFGEWIKLTEKTYEEFEAQAFDLESETLTLVFNGQNFTLSLEQSKSSQGVAPASPSLPKVNLPRSTASSSSQRTMPPRPRSAPQLPDWLASRMSSRSGSASPSSPSNSFSSRYSPSSRVSSSSSSNGISSPIGNSPPNTINSTLSNGASSSATFSNSNPVTNNFSSVSNISTGLNSPTTSDSSNGKQQASSSSAELPEESNVNETDQSELDNLPPPPPPPNILPPTPPPDILPSLDE